MKEVLLDIPQTAMEVFEMLPEGTRCEVIDNALYMSPSPTTDHQDILGDIYLELGPICKKNRLGKIYLAPCDVYLDSGTSAVQPDLLFIKEERRSIIEKKGIFGTPDFVVEILSNNIKHDTVTKLEVYQRNLIPEYFIIDPETKEVWHYLLVNDFYVLKPTIAGQLNIHQLSLEINF
jgi:Uma2 family endonuclease